MKDSLETKSERFTIQRGENYINFLDNGNSAIIYYPRTEVFLPRHSFLDKDLMQFALDEINK